MARDEKIIITKYHGHCVASSCGRCLQRFSDKYDKSCEGTNKKCQFYSEIGMSYNDIINIMATALNNSTLLFDANPEEYARVMFDELLKVKGVTICE